MEYKHLLFTMVFFFLSLTSISFISALTVVRPDVLNTSSINVNSSQNSILWNGHAFVAGAVSSIESDPVFTSWLISPIAYNTFYVEADGITGFRQRSSLINYKGIGMGVNTGGTPPYVFIQSENDTAGTLPITFWMSTTKVATINETGIYEGTSRVCTNDNGVCSNYALNSSLNGLAKYQFTNNNFNGSGNFTTTGTGTFGQIIDSGLTSTRVIFTDANKQLTDDAEFTYNAITRTLILNKGQIDITGDATTTVSSPNVITAVGGVGGDYDATSGFNGGGYSLTSGAGGTGVVSTTAGGNAGVFTYTGGLGGTSGISSTGGIGGGWTLTFGNGGTGGNTGDRKSTR